MEYLITGTVNFRIHIDDIEGATQKEAIENAKNKIKEHYNITETRESFEYDVEVDIEAHEYTTS